MATGNRQSIYWVTATFLAFVLAVAVLQGCKREKPAAPAGKTPAGGVTAVPAANKEPANNPIETAKSLFREPKESIQNIVKTANDRWTPVCQQWWDKPAPDFTLTDIEGQAHKLSDYKGKNVVIAMFATWAGASKVVVPPLKELRGAYPKDNLAILAISSEPAALVKTFAADQGVNFTVLTNSGTLPSPFDQVKVSPTTFFVGADGKFKIAIEGMVPAADAKAILQAQ
jgi:peroxiredoxin